MKTVVLKGRDKSYVQKNGSKERWQWPDLHDSTISLEGRLLHLISLELTADRKDKQGIRFVELLAV